MTTEWAIGTTAAAPTPPALPTGPEQAWARLSDAERETLDYDSFSDGYAAAVEELRATASHWRPFGVEAKFIKALGVIADTIMAGWECYDSGHGNKRCKMRRAAQATGSANPIG